MTDLATLGIAVDSKGAVSATSDLDRLTASAAKAEQATKSLEASTTKAGTATAQMGKNVAQALSEYDKLGAVEKELATQANTLGKVATATGTVTAASRLGAAQMMSLSHSARSAAESLLIGASPLQAFAQQANHLSFALSGPQGLIAATAASRAAFVGWLASTPGLITTAGVGAVAAVAAYLLATREDIKSVDEILEGHKALIEEIAGAYPKAEEALKHYEAEAKKLPQSVVVADIAKNVSDAQKTLSSLLDGLRIDLSVIGGDFGVMGAAGSEAFSKLSAGIKDGSVNAEALQDALGKLRIDPNLSDFAKEFAASLQDRANDAAKAAKVIASESGLKDVIVDGKQVEKTLSEIAAGFKDVGSKAGDADSIIAKLFGGVNTNVSTSALGKMSASIEASVGQFGRVDDVFKKVRQDQLSGILELEQKYRDATKSVETWSKALETAGGKENINEIFGDVSGIKGANEAIQDAISTVNKLFDALNSGGASASTVASGLDMIRQTLIQNGLGVDQVNKFINSLILARQQMDAGSADAAKLNRAIQAIKNRTVTITVVTRRVGSGTQSLYDVPNGSGGTSTVGVTRYGGDDETSGPSITSNSVPRTSGYGSMGGSGDLGSTNVNVTRFATGGMIHPGDTQRVSFFKSPDETVGIFTPQQMNALAGGAQSLGTTDTSATDKLSMAITDTAANTKKTAQILDDIKTSSASASSAFGGSSYGDPSSDVDTSQQAQLSAQYAQVLKQVQANFQAAGIIGRGIIGYGLDGLAATPQEIARNIVYGGSHPTMGFASGGMIGGDAGDTQKVEFFKNPNERVIIARPDQFEDVRSQTSTIAVDQRPIVFHMPITVQANAQVSNDSIAEMKRQFALQLREGLRSINGR
jgi:hypothetical protein